MFQKSTLSFLKQLKHHNSKEWMDANRPSYESAKNDFEIFVSGLIDQLSGIGVNMEGISAKQCVFRLNRDIRFSNNKDPYKTNFGAAFVPGGKKSGNAGYYFHFEPGQSFIGGGMWMPEAAQLKKIRQEIDYNFKEFREILHNPAFKKLYTDIDGEKLKKAPQGYDPENPAIEYLKLKSYTVGHSVKDSELHDASLLKSTIQAFKIMKPFVDFLNRSQE